MKRRGKLSWLPIIWLLVMIPMTSPQAQPRSEGGGEEETILVGRISHVEGEVSRYVPDEKDWVATVKDTPFGIHDALYSDKGGRAEIIMPNNTWTRIDGDTQVQLIELRGDVTEIDVASGVARFYNKGSDVVIKATTPFGYVMAPEKTSFDLYVDDDSAEVMSLKGTVDFVHDTSETRFEVIAGSSSILADSRQVTAGEGRKESYWHAWNGKRDTLWARRMQVRGASVKYLPPGLHHEAYVLDEHGRWERVYYDGAYRYFWRPVHVSVGWAPFTVGRWTVWYGDHTWVPCEPFGYVTHHYGNWIFTGGLWYWAPPVPRVRVCVGPPLLPIPFFWYPGRVAWIHFGVRVGWVPLAPWEPYYCYRRWGPRTIVIRNVTIANININMRRYRHFKRAVIINRNNFYRVNNYGNVRIRHIRSNTIVKNYRVAPAVDNRVIKNYKDMRKRYNFTNVNLTRKPPRTAVKRIKHNQIVAERRVNVKAKAIRQNVRNMKEGRVERGARIRPSKVKEREVPVNRVNRPVSQGKLEEKKLKTKPRSRTEDQGQARGKVEEGKRKKSPHVVKKPGVQRGDQGQGSRKVQKIQRTKPPRIVKGQEIQRGDQRRDRNKLQGEQRSIPPRPVQQVREGKQRREPRHDRQLQQWQPKQQKNSHNTGRDEEIGGGFSQPDLPTPKGAARSRSRHGPGSDRIGGRNLKRF